MAGVLVVTAGLVVLASRASREAGFGWFAYAPVAEEQLDAFVAVNGARALGAGLVAVGLALVALAVGARAGRAGARSGSRRGVAVVGGLVVVAGLVTSSVPRQVLVVGSEPAVTSSPVLLPVQVVGLGVALVGVLLLVGVGGAALGSTRPSGPPRA